ncbi:hypothetical protein CPB85DRAFT_1263239 [Mucidula mucida]|nr:hypothetical protein CPB85DRAFT_1263239 [Mucidula mucida]
MILDHEIGGDLCPRPERCIPHREAAPINTAKTQSGLILETVPASWILETLYELMEYEYSLERNFGFNDSRSTVSPPHTRVLNSRRTLETVLRGGRIISQHLPKLPLSHHGVGLPEPLHVRLGICTRKRYKRRWDFSKSIITYFPSFSPSSIGLLICFLLSISCALSVVSDPPSDALVLALPALDFNLSTPPSHSSRLSSTTTMMLIGLLRHRRLSRSLGHRDSKPTFSIQTLLSRGSWNVLDYFKTFSLERAPGSLWLRDSSHLSWARTGTSLSSTALGPASFDGSKKAFAADISYPRSPLVGFGLLGPTISHSAARKSSPMALLCVEEMKFTFHLDELTVVFHNAEMFLVEP